MIDQENQDQLIQRFNSEQGTYNDFALTFSDLVNKVLLENKISVHSVTYRCKTVQSLSRKVARPDKDYSSLDDITDLAGVRITTYFDEDVDRVADVVQAEFEIDRINSVDKRQVLDADRFGYQSLHYVVSIPNERCAFTEYKRFKGRKLEIQIRSILQHAWAEIEHDLGYKSEAGIPKTVRRRFARVAGLLELADAEFSALRATLHQYEIGVSEKVTTNPEAVNIDLPSLKAAYSTSEVLKSLDQAVAAAANAKIIYTSFSLLERMVDRLEFVKVFNIGTLENIASNHLEKVEFFAKEWLEGKSHSKFSIGIGLMYLIYVILGEKAERQVVLDYLTQSGIGNADDRDSIADRIFEISAKLTSIN